VEVHHHSYPLSALVEMSGLPYTLATLATGNQPTALKEEGRRAPQPASTFLRRKKSLAPVENRVFKPVA
jgi:hypothetical protein